MTRRWTQERLARTSLRRQFPRIRGRGPAAVVEAYRRLGPIQTQVPRAAHLALASRLPGVTYDAITAAFESYDVVKASNLRGTVHTSTAEQHGWLASVCDRPRDLAIANHLKIAGITPRDVTDEIERYAHGEWRERKDLVAHMWDWLDERGAGRSNGAASNTMSDSLLWGHARLVRRPRDTAWERRTDVYHQAASTVLGAEPVRAEEAIERLVRLHLSAYGPATRRDIAWWMGSTLTPVDDAVTRLGDDLVAYPSDDRDPYLDLAAPRKGDGSDPGTRLLPEFDGLVLGYAPPNRGRFAHPDHLDRIFARENGLMSPAVLRDGRIVATWKLTASGKRNDIVVAMLPAFSPVLEDELAGPVADVAAALAIEVSDVRITRV
ncbi:winged helix DNA-binding domain-containing protein [Solicola gregarius]|uniref:Winged helix DNA-binding domain-containing protein n=1 Tax=Solicola gregarius TaxID=2908642 RepID=A0AA46TGS9_9ACTN|nr:winged helix DNA-binding domain-containing protein [Solicola gregarius]UYM04865.1 winged helix DNA-binding domain-containing protein [Solicola gregarius]